MTSRTGVCVLWLLLASGLLACDPSDPCDPGYRADHGACLRTATKMMEQDAGQSDAAMEFDESDFGYSCTTDADCGGSAPSCGAPRLPICTAINCLNGAAKCPSSWECLDVSAWTPDPKIQSVCVKL
jgi:hypothetical protein